MTETLWSTWQATVRAAPDATALIDAATGRVHSRANLDQQAAAWHEVNGGGLSDRTVVLAEPNGPGWWRVFLGLLRAGAVVVPLDPGEPPAVQQAIAATLRATALWRDGQLNRLPAPGRRASDGRRLVKLTSGSTGRPRAIPFTDAQMLADGRQVSATMEITGSDLNLGLIPFGHSYGLGNLVVPLLMQGTALVSGVAPIPHAIAAAALQFRPTVFPSVPALLRALAGSGIAPDSLRSLRTVISAGAPLAPEVAVGFHARFGRKIHGFYGSTETGGITYDKTGDAALTGRSVGTPLEGVKLLFGPGRRFSVQSPAVYTIGNRGRTGEGLGLHRPADLGELSSNGELVLQGRAGRVVKIAGRRLSLSEVEHALRQVPGVRDALVVPHPARDDALAAAIAADVSAEQLRASLRDRLASWKIPKKIAVMPSFPVTARGKTDTRQLRAMLESG